MDKQELFAQIANPAFDASSLDYETRVGLVAELLDTKEIYQRTLGKIAASLPGDKTGVGEKHLRKFAHEVEQITGRKG